MGRKESNQTIKLFRITNRVDTDQTASEEAVWSGFALFVYAFLQATSVPNFRTFTVTRMLIQTFVSPPISEQLGPPWINGIFIFSLDINNGILLCDECVHHSVYRSSALRVCVGHLERCHKYSLPVTRSFFLFNFQKMMLVVLFRNDSWLRHHQKVLLTCHEYYVTYHTRWWDRLPDYCFSHIVWQNFWA